MKQNPSAGAPRIASLLVVRLSAMGDIIHALPAVTALRRAFPDAQLGWLVEERWAALLTAPGNSCPETRSPRQPLVDRVHTVNTKAWRHAVLSAETWREIGASLRDVRGRRYDAVVDFQGAVRSALLARGSGAPIVYGSAQPREKVACVLYTRKVALESRDRHVVEQAVSLAEALMPLPIGDRAARDIRVEFPVDGEAEKKVAAIAGGRKAFAILNPGAGWGAKCWPAERYGAVARELVRDGLDALVNYGPGEEELALAVENASEGTAQKISCSVSELIALTRRASLFLGGDTGPMHMAAALRVPVVALFGPTNPQRNGPFGTRSIVLRSSSSVTDHSRHRKPEAGLLKITAAEVTVAARSLLREAAESR
jgi:heptosyltransferase-1